MRDYNHGISCIIANNKKGRELLEHTLDNCVCEISTVSDAKTSNKSLSEPYKIPNDKLNIFWDDYNSEMSIVDLDNKYTHGHFKIPKHINYYRLKRKYFWLKVKIKKIIKKG